MPAKKTAEQTAETVQETPQMMKFLYPIDPYRDDQEETFTNNGKVIRITRGKSVDVTAEDYAFLQERMEAEQRYFEERRRTQAEHSDKF